ncbi:hypothetical protein ACU639_35875 [Streptomyces cynarae]|uniref:hypothetical protein n=1 Tax=Streptomyces cynarae TaxID=2981134 RepID=UPI00406CA540
MAAAGCGRALYCHADDPEPGIGDHGERHLVQLWRATQAPPLHPEITEEDRQARAEYAADRARLWQLVRDRWHTGFVVALGTGGRLLGQVAPPRTYSPGSPPRPLEGRESIRHVVIDMSTTYRAALRNGEDTSDLTAVMGRVRSRFNSLASDGLEY